MKIHEHPALHEQWSPAPQSTAVGSSKSPVGNRDILEAVYFYAGSRQLQPNVTLTTSYAGRTYARDIFLEDRGLAEKLALLFKQHIGKTVAELGDLEIGF